MQSPISEIASSIARFACFLDAEMPGEKYTSQARLGLSRSGLGLRWKPEICPYSLAPSARTVNVPTT